VDGQVEEDTSLLYSCDVFSSKSLVEIGEALVVEGELSAGGDIEAEQELRDGGFTGTGTADDECPFAGRKKERDIAEDRLIRPRWVGEGDVSKVKFTSTSERSDTPQAERAGLHRDPAWKVRCIR